MSSIEKVNSGKQRSGTYRRKQRPFLPCYTALI